jgi:hypothetical protein
MLASIECRMRRAANMRSHAASTIAGTEVPRGGNAGGLQKRAVNNVESWSRRTKCARL